MPKPIEPLDQDEMLDLTRRIFAARDEEAARAAELGPVRERAADARRRASACRRGTLAVLDEFRAAGTSGEDLAAFLSRLQAAREEERKAEAVEGEMRRACRECRKEARRAHASIAALVDGFDDMPLIALMIRNARLNGQAEADAGDTKPARGRRCPSAG